MSGNRQTFTGRDLAEAIAAARQHFGVGRQEIEFEITERSKIGEIGEVLPTVEITAWVREGGPRVLPERPERGPRERGGGGGRGRGPRRDGDDRRPRRAHDAADGDFDRPRPRASRGDEPPARHAEPVQLEPLFPPAEVTDPAEVLRALAGALVGGLGLSLHVDGIEQTEAGHRVKLEGEDVGLLLEADAEGLEALQYLANRLLQKDGRITGRVSFDAGGHRARTEARIVAEALEIAEQVRRTGQARKMPALGPYERRLVHLALSGQEGIKTFSTGSGYHRRLHIAAADGTPAPTENDA